MTFAEFEKRNVVKEKGFSVDVFMQIYVNVRKDKIMLKNFVCGNKSLLVPDMPCRISLLNLVLHREFHECHPAKR